jgi:hypothetical protein
MPVVHSCVVRLVCLVTAFAVSASGCTSMHRVPVVTADSPQVGDRIEPGDVIRVTMRDGRQARFTVKRVEEAALIAIDGTRYDNSNIVTLDRREFSGGKTALLVAGIVGGVLFFAYAAAVASLGSP